jgi:Ca-activated chloride channel family protein
MHFLTPTFLFLAGLAGPIILLYMLRLRRRELPVSSIMLWQRLVQDREANTPWQRLRRNLLLLLQLLILAALVVALARPFIPVPSVAAGSVALLLDASASMNADDMPGGATRFEVAQSQARALVGELASGDVMTVVAVGPTPLVLTPPTADRAILREAINRARPAQAPADWESALALAGASIAGREDATIVILSDGGLPADLPPVPADVRYVPVGREGDNLAISALATRALGEAPQLFAAVTNYGGQEADVILSLEVDGQLFSAERLTVPPGETTDLTIADLPDTARVIRAELTPPVEGGAPDYLPLDDVAYAVYTPPAGGRVLLVTDGNLFLEQVLASLPTVEAFRVSPGMLPEGEFDLMVFDGWLPPGDLPEANLLIVKPTHSTNLFTVGEDFANTHFLRQADDPILAFVDFEEVAIREAALVQAPGWAQTLVEAEGGPLLLAGSVDGQRIAVLTFDLHASDLPLKIDFPILMANLVEWFAPARAFDAPDGLLPGEPLVIRPQATTDRYRITLPDGSTQVFEVSEGVLTFPFTTQLGVYTVELLGGEEVQGGGSFAVNLFAPGESAIAPADEIMVGQVEVGGSGPGEEAGQRELWPWLAVAALAVLLVEWWVYHRGSVLPGRRETAEGQHGLATLFRRGG